MKLEILVTLFVCLMGQLSMASDEESPDIQLLRSLGGNIVRKPDTAKRIAESIIGDVYGASELAKQAPLNVTDQGDQWLIQGSFNPDGQEEGFGSIRVLVSKRDGRILKLDRPLFVEPPTAVRDLMKKDPKKDQ